jgi:hypothetical protein
MSWVRKGIAKTRLTASISQRVGALPVSEVDTFKKRVHLAEECKMSVEVCVVRCIVVSGNDNAQKVDD